VPKQRITKTVAYRHNCPAVSIFLGIFGAPRPVNEVSYFDVDEENVILILVKSWRGSS
jgi:hypothetical protein